MKTKTFENKTRRFYKLINALIFIFIINFFDFRFNEFSECLCKILILINKK
ncbi:Uncharacterised protein [Serratia entomophila]|nr:Uncharacterised protein [Serratia entomophila]